MHFKSSQAGAAAGASPSLASLRPSLQSLCVEGRVQGRSVEGHVQGSSVEGRVQGRSVEGRVQGSSGLCLWRGAGRFPTAREVDGLSETVTTEALLFGRMLFEFRTF